MRELTFNVEFLSDIVLLATSNTEGNIEALDYIPGSNFLGMVAKEYDKFSDGFKIFHSGDVRFGDATVIANGKATYKIPLSFFYEKLDESKMVNHHMVKDFSKYDQLKQKRQGFITKDLEEIQIKYNYAQKSAYDKVHRRSKDSSMYGYNALPAKSKWQFSVKISDGVTDEEIELIKKNILGKQRLGKSKSSQYGLVNITEANKLECVEFGEPKNEVFVYTKSRLALVDENGNPTFNVKYLLDDLKDENVVWDKLQIRTTTFTPYNVAMQTKTYERLVIKSGSVIVLKNISKEQIQRLKQGVGAFLSEGFGELLINPKFLEIDGEFSLSKEKTEDEDIVKKSKTEITDDMARFLKMREEAKKALLDGAYLVDEFISKNRNLYKNITNSQWGTIRSICDGFENNFIEEIKEYISSGKVTWSKEQIDRLLKLENRELIKLLAINMPKQSRGEKDD